MKFLVDDKIQSEGRELNFIDVGIHTNVELVEIKVDTSPKTNSNFIAFTFEDMEGRKLTKTEYQPSGEEDAKLISKAKNQAKRIKHIMTRYLPVEQTVIEYDLDNWTKYASTVKAKLDPVIKGTKVRIKAIYDDKGYVTLPNYLPFIERMDAPESKLTISSIDKMTRDNPDVEVPVQDLHSILHSTDQNQSKGFNLADVNSEQDIDTLLAELTQ